MTQSSALVAKSLMANEESNLTKPSNFSDVGLWEFIENLQVMSTQNIDSGIENPGMVYVSGGVFKYGCNKEFDVLCDRDEISLQDIDIDGFWIDKNEVSVADFMSCVEAGFCQSTPKSELIDNKWAKYCNWNRRLDHPMNCISWYQADKYCRWMDKSLPTEQQWEKAARGIDGRIFPWGNVSFERLGDQGKVYANIADKSAREKFAWFWAVNNYEDRFAATSPVGSFAEGASPYGALDMVGNVWEWTSTPYRGRGTRVIRGGSWDTHPRWARTSGRLGNRLSVSSELIGLRCVKER